MTDQAVEQARIDVKPGVASAGCEADHSGGSRQGGRFALRSGRFGRVVGTHLPFAVILMVAGLLLSMNMTASFTSEHDINGTVFGSIAANHLRLGIGHTKGQDFWDMESLSPDPGGVGPASMFEYYRSGATTPAVYGDHPGFLGLTVAAAFKVFGYGYGVERLVPIGYSLGCLVLLYLLIGRLFGIGVARAATLFMALTPMFAFFGRNVCHEAPTLFWCLALTGAYFAWRDGRRYRRLAAGCMVVSIFIGGGYGWPMYYWAATVFLAHCFVVRRIELRMVALVAVPAVVTLAVMVSGLLLVTGDRETLTRALLGRSSAVGPDGRPFSTLEWVGRLCAFNAHTFGSWTQVLLLPVVGFVLTKVGREIMPERLMLVGILATAGLAHLLIFRNGAYIHEYWQFYLLPCYALTFGWAWTGLLDRFAPVGGTRIAALVGAGFVVFFLNAGTIGDYFSVGGTHPVNSVLSRFF